MSILFENLFRKKKTKVSEAGKFNNRRLEIELMEERITPATISVNGSSQVVLTMVTGEKISSLHVDIVGSTITITDTTKSNNTTSGVIPAGVTVNNTNIVVDASTFTGFAGLVVNAASGSSDCQIVVDSAGIDLSSAPGGANQSVSIDLTASAKATLDVKSIIKTKGSGTVDFNVATIGITAAGDITTNAGDVNISGATLVETAGDITTSGGNIIFNDNLTLVGDVVLGSGSGTILFSNTLDGDHNLNVNSSGITTFGGIVGATKALKTITTNAGGTTNINTSAITSTGAQIYNDAVELGADVILDAGAGNITFGGTLNGAFNLNAKSSAVTTFSGNVGVANALTSITTNAGGSTVINTAVINTTGNQVYSDAVTLGTDATLSGSTPTFSLGVTGANHDLTLNFSGTTTIGPTFAGIKNLTTNAAGTTSLSGTITTTGNQIFNDAVVLSAATILNAASGVTLGSTLNGSGFTMNVVAGALALNGNVSNVSTLGIANVSAAGTITLMGSGGLAIETQAEWDFIQPSVGTVIFGSKTNTGQVTIGGPWANSNTVTVDFQTGGAGKFNVNGAITGAGTLLVNGSGNTTNINADITQASISITDSVVVGGGVNRVLTATAVGGVSVDSTGFVAGISASAPSTSLILTTIFPTAPISLKGTLTNAGSSFLTDLQMGGNAVTSGAVTFSASGSINGGLLLGNSSGINLDSNTGTLAAFSMGFGVATTLTGLTSLQATSDISFNNSITGGANSLALNASGIIQATSLITTNNLTITNSNGTIFTGTVGANNVVISDSNDGSTVAFQDNLTITGGMTVAATGAYNVSITGLLNSIAGDTNFLNSGGVTIGTALGTSSLIGGLDTTAATITNIAGIVKTTNTAMDLGNTTLLADASLLSGSALINVASITDGPATLALTLGNGSQTGTINITGNTTVDTLNTSAGAYNVGLLGNANTITNNAFFLNTGVLTIGQALGTSTFVGGLDTTSNISTNISGVVQSTNTQISLAATTLLADANLLSGSGLIFLPSITDGAGSFALGLGNISQTGMITVTGNITVDTLNTGAGAYNIELTGTSNSITTNTNFLNSGGVTLGDGGDNFNFDGGLNFTGNAASIVRASINSSGDVINFGSGGVTLGANSSVATITGSASGANIIFGAGIGGGAFDLGLDAGTGGAINGVSVSINNLTITNGASASFTGAVTLNDLITTANPYSLAMTGSGNTFLLNVDFLNTGNVTLGDATGDTFLFNAGINFTGNAASNLGATINSSGDSINFGTGGATLSTNSLINSTIGGGGADIAFGGTFNGGFSLGLTAGTGTIFFNGTVGNTAGLAALTVSSASDILIGAAFKAAGPVSITADTGVNVFLGTAGAGLSLTDAELDFITTTGNLAISALGAGNMVVNNVTGGGAITGTTTLSAGGTGVSFITTSSNFNNALTVASDAILGVNILTSNDATTFNNPVTLSGNAIIDTGVGNILFNSTLNGAFNFNAKSSSTTTFGGAVGGIGIALSSLTTNSGGLTLINGGAITTTGNQTYNDAITLGANTTLNTGTGNILFVNSITSAFDLNLNSATGAITGTSVAIKNLTITNCASASFTGAVTVNDLITTANPYTVSMTGTGNTFAQNVAFLNTGAVVLNGTSGDVTTFAAGLVATSPSSLTIQGTVAATNSNMTLGDADTGVILASNTTLNAGIGNINLDGTVSGAFSLTPITSSPGLTTIIGANTNITTNVTTGVVQINNSLPQTTNYSVSGGTLKGNGAIGNLNGTGTGIIAPGNSPGQITTKSLSLSPTNTIQIELEGTIPGTQYDQIVVGPSGTVVLGNAILSLSSTFAGSAGAVFVIIDNQSLSSVIGTFAGLPEGAVVSAGGQAYKISYAGGTGNDVTLTVLPTVTLNTSNLTITTPTLTITGTGFDTTPANNIVSFNNGAIGTVTSATSTQLTIDFSTLPTSTGSLTAIVTTNGQSSGTPVQVATIIPQPVPPLITGTPPLSSGGSSVVSLYDPITGEPSGTVVPFPGFTGEIRVISGDLNNDGKLDIIAAAGPGGGPAVVVLDSETGAVLQSFFAFDPAFTGGVFVAVRDFNGDGILDIIAGAGMGGGPEVRIFDGANLNIIRAFFAYDQNFTGGVRVAAVDFNADGILDIVTGAGPGGAPHVKVFDGATNSIISQWFAYPISFTGGVFVAAGDVDDDGSIELVTGAGMGGAPVVAVWDPLTGALISQFMAYAMEFSGGVRVGVSDGNGDGILDLITGAGPGGGPEVKGFSFPALDLLFSFYSGDPANSGGVFVS